MPRPVRRSGVIETPRSKGVSTAIYSAPLCTEDAVYFGSFDGYLYCLKIADGELKWRIRPVEGSEITGSPLTDGRRIFLSMRRNSEAARPARDRRHR